MNRIAAEIPKVPCAEVLPWPELEPHNPSNGAEPLQNRIKTDKLHIKKMSHFVIGAHTLSDRRHIIGQRVESWRES